MSTRTQIELMWPIQLDNEIPVTGYILEADIEHNGRFDVIWNGEDHPELNSFILTGVETGNFYNFRYKVLNWNGESPYSEIFKTWACELPSKPVTPTWITSSETSI